MTNEEIVSLIQKGIDETENLQILYKQNVRFIQRMVNRYSQVQDKEDLVQEGYFGLYEASQKYQANHGVKFITYAGYWIKQAILRYIKGNGTAVRLPEYLQERIRRYRKWVNAYNTQLGRNPTDRELCRHLKINLSMLLETKKAFHECGNIKSLDTPMSDDEDTLLGDIIPGVDSVEDEVIDNIMAEDGVAELWQVIQEHTTEQENSVLVDRYKRHRTHKEIGESIGRSHERARQIEGKALRKLRRPECSKKIMEALDLNYDLAYRGGLSSFRHTWTSSTELAAIKNWETEKNFYSHEASRNNKAL